MSEFHVHIYRVSEMCEYNVLADTDEEALEKAFKMFCSTIDKNRNWVPADVKSVAIEFKSSHNKNRTRA